MKTLVALSLAFVAHAALADCPERLQRDPEFIALAVDDNSPRPKSPDDFKFIGDTTTFDELQSKVGTPDAKKGMKRFLWCFADGKVVEVETRTGSDIKTVRVDGKAVYKRK